MNAFEVTIDDVATVLKNSDVTYGWRWIEKIYHDHISDESDRIEKAALRGNDIDEQTNYAHDEIKKILIEKNLIIPKLP